MRKRTQDQLSALGDGSCASHRQGRVTLGDYLGGAELSGDYGTAKSPRGGQQRSEPTGSGLPNLLRVTGAPPGASTRCREGWYRPIGQVATRPARPRYHPRTLPSRAENPTKPGPFRARRDSRGLGKRKSAAEGPVQRRLPNPECAGDRAGGLALIEKHSCVLDSSPRKGRRAAHAHAASLRRGHGGACSLRDQRALGAIEFSKRAQQAKDRPPAGNRVDVFRKRLKAGSFLVDLSDECD